MTSPILKLQQVTRRFGGLVAVDRVDMEIFAGEVIGLVGPNGSGKTTALNLVSGALSPTSGTIQFLDQTISGLASHRIARMGVARTFQLVRVLGSLTCAENVEVGLAFHPNGVHGKAARKQAIALLTKVGLQSQADTPASKLTYIDQKRLELARALALHPRLLLLDEWLAGLNPTELQEGIELIRSMRADGITIVMVEHVMDAVNALCTRCIVLSSGQKIADGPTREVLSNPAVIAAYLGEDESDAEEEVAHA
ncbi:UNVERIFIED_CONTAM: ABC transporter ATP-binding protein [Comamonas sp. A-3]|uniref:ABC transporter ATP-binding protein n=1 Tax=Comamonas TaxID=283 RepID=UPI0001DA65E9|nr:MULTISPECIES: ABC transporter ATP-binding protein [Comamonas]EFI60985.1 high-affinity branched-chain amino acidtransport ATP-binding protein livG [Comamonas thiooxydans]MCO8251648.1 ABC transporter ATP-binding protein [Comamonas thiooxydans]TFF54364.1 ABC transporter ATP-binding protein [Comamonas sp. A23]TYK69646.1 ABC transporter ATP-binding protein [Comamonas sp. Z1]